MKAEPAPLAQVAKLGLFSATSIVIANIIGTGIFTTTGFQAATIPSQFAILFIWLLGGVLALCGALTYGELASAMPRSGGEYHFLGQLYHPALGFISGIISLVAGFSAPVAASAAAFAKYLVVVFPGINATWAAALLVTLLTLLHSLNVHTGSRVQNVFTLLKVGLILFFILAGLLMAHPQPVQLIPTAADWQAVLSAGFAVGLVYVSFSYSGWNAAAYMTGEIANARRNVPRALLMGTLVVLALYLLVNFVYLASAPLSALAGKAEVGEVSANAIFGARGGQIVSMLIAFALVSSVSSMTMAGPRVLKSMGEDMPAFNFLAQHNRSGVPRNALLLQYGIAMVIIFTSSFESILSYIGFTLSLFALLTVGGIFIHRARLGNKPNPATYTTWGYPITPLLFILLSGWMVVHLISQRPIIALWGFATVLVGWGLYFLLGRRMDATPSTPA